MKIFFIVVFLAFLSTFLFAQENNSSSSGEKMEGRIAPNFKLENLNGGYTELSDELGKGPVLLSFWATWCKPCVEELTELKKVYEDYKSKGFNILAISIDDEKTISKVKPFVRTKGFPFTILLDPNSDAARKYYAYNPPYTVLINKKGEIVYTHLGYMRGDELKVRQEVGDLLQNSAQTKQGKD
jgi:cytochrome c biogenesis protein CcmG, thiol:disulfide interchange protein DsbE